MVIHGKAQFRQPDRFGSEGPAATAICENGHSIRVSGPGTLTRQLEILHRLLEKTGATLKPCPFCGSQPVVVRSTPRSQNGTIRCPSCWVETRTAQVETVIREWNNRHG